MTPNLELLKKIQPIFTEWNVWDRYYCPLHAAYGSDGIKYIHHDNCIDENLEPCCPNVAIHYPYPHQMWEKVNWRLFEKREITGDGKLWIRPVNEKHGWNLDTETALLKALVFQMEQEEDSDRGKQGMIKINSKMFYCECGCNVFTKLDKDHFRCNSCEAIYYGE